MFIFVNKYDNVVLCITTEMGYLENGYPINKTTNTSYVKETTIIYEEDNIPEDIEKIKYCYTPEDGFFLNKKYKEPKDELSFRVKKLEDDGNAMLADIQYLLLLSE